MWKKKDGNSVVDAGVYDGETSLKILRRYKPQSIIGFEPNPIMYEVSKKRLKGGGRNLSLCRMG